MARGNGHLEWESSRDEKYAENWWETHGFTWKLTKRFVSYSEYEINKDGITFYYSIPNNGKMNMKKFMEGPAGFTEAWRINAEYQRLLREAKARNLA